jgi:hypothetical protein
LIDLDGPHRAAFIEEHETEWHRSRSQIRQSSASGAAEPMMADSEALIGCLVVQVFA